MNDEAFDYWNNITVLAIMMIGNRRKHLCLWGTAAAAAAAAASPLSLKKGLSLAQDPHLSRVSVQKNHTQMERIDRE